MRLVFMGSSDSSRFCLGQILEAGHSIELVITQPDRPAGRGKKLRPSPVKNFALERKLPVIAPARIRKNPEFRQKLQDIRPDLIVVVAYGQIIPRSLFLLPEHNSVNLHYSYLPFYRGASPVQGALLNCETSTGVTIFELDTKMDEGPVYAQQKVAILAGENAQELEERLTRIGSRLLIETLPRIPEMQPVPQNHDAATYARLIKKADGLLDWNQDTVRVDGRVRAFTPWPSAFTFLNGTRLKILKGRPLLESESSSKRPGSIEGIDRDGIRAACGDSRFFLIEEIQPENRKAMTAYEFALGSRLKPGAVFG